MNGSAARRTSTDLRRAAAVGAIVALDAWAAQEPREQFGAQRNRRKEHVLVRCVRPGALGAEAVEDGDPDSANEVSVGTAAGRFLFELQPELATVRPRLLAGLLGVDPPLVNIKGKTHEKVDALGENRAIACHVILLLASQ